MQLLTVPQLQAFVRDNQITCQDKRVRKNLEQAIELWQAKQTQVIEVATEIQAAIVTTEEEAIESAVVASVMIEDAIVAIFKAITSPEACKVYRSVLHAVMLAIVFMALLTGKIAQWAWAHRDQTAVYRWVQSALVSRWGLRVRTELLGASLVWSLSVDRYHQQVDRLLNRLGLGGCAIEIQ